MVSPLPDTYRLELTVVRPGAPDRDVHIPVLGDHPYLTLEIRAADPGTEPGSSPESDDGAGLPLVAIRAGGLGEDPQTLGRLLSQIGATLEGGTHAG